MMNVKIGKIFYNQWYGQITENHSTYSISDQKIDNQYIVIVFLKSFFLRIA